MSAWQAPAVYYTPSELKEWSCVFFRVIPGIIHNRHTPLS